MPLFGLIKKNKKKTKDQQTPDENDDKEASSQSSSTNTGAGPAAAAGASVSKSTSNQSSSSNKKQLNKVKSDQSATSSNLTPVRTISHKTPNPFTAQPVNIPKNPGLSPPADLDQNRMYSSSPFSTSPQPPLVSSRQQQYQQHQQQQQQQPHLQNVVTGQYNAPPTPPSTARSGSIDDKIDSLSPAITNTTTQPYHHDQLKHPQPQQGYQQYNNDVPSADAMIASSSGLLTPVPNANDRVIPSHLPSVQAASPVRTTKGKYSIVDFSIQRTLGTGSFGRVHLVQSRHNSRFYAIKVTSLRVH
jgi:hypothetical protein